MRAGPLDREFGGYALLGFLEAEPDLERDLEMMDHAVFEMASGRYDLEPVDVSQGLGRAVESAPDRRVRSFG